MPPTPRIVPLPRQPGLHFPRCSGVPRGGATWAVGEGAARAAGFSQWRARWGGHVLLFGAFVRARVCWCSECGQAARTEQVGAGLWEEAAGGWGPARGMRPAGGAGPWQRPPAGGRRAWPRAPSGTGGRGSLRFVYGSGGASALSPLPGGAAIVGRGRGQLGEPWALALGAVLETIGGVGPRLPPSFHLLAQPRWGPHCLKGRGGASGGQRP